MEDLELMRHITIGQYLATGSRVHRLDPRTKLIGIGLLILSIIFIRSVGGLVALLAVIIGLVLLARVPLGFALGGLRPALPILIIIAILQLLFGWGAPDGMVCPPLWSYWIIKINGCSILSVIGMILRLTALILLTGMLTMTSTISELTHGIEKLLRPLQKIGFPSHEIAMVFTIALRFVPTLAEELEKLLKAQVARGADIRLGANPIQRTRHFLPVLIPLFLTTLRRGELLIEAMEARGYTGSQGRSHYIQLHFTSQDGLALLLVIGLLAGLMFAPFNLLDSKFLLLLAQLTGQ